MAARRRYRPRARVNFHLGCLGCWLPLLLFAVTVALVIGALW